MAYEKCIIIIIMVSVLKMSLSLCVVFHWQDSFFLLYPFCLVEHVSTKIMYYYFSYLLYTLGRYG